jgi:hypothetical protein
MLFIASSASETMARAFPHAPFAPTAQTNTGSIDKIGLAREDNPAGGETIRGTVAA